MIYGGKNFLTYFGGGAIDIGRNSGNNFGSTNFPNEYFGNNSGITKE